MQEATRQDIAPKDTLVDLFLLIMPHRLLPLSPIMSFYSESIKESFHPLCQSPDDLFLRTASLKDARSVLHCAHPISNPVKLVMKINHHGCSV